MNKLDLNNKFSILNDRMVDDNVVKDHLIPDDEIQQSNNDAKSEKK